MDATVFEIDAADRIRSVDDAWRVFATENGAAEALADDQVIGRELWDFVVGRELRLLYMGLFERIRRTGDGASVAFRCDSPGEERHMRLEIEPAGGNAATGGLRLTSRTLRRVRRPPILLLDPKRSRSGRSVRPPLTICSLCKAIKRGTVEWLPLPVAVEELGLMEAQERLPELSHGVCPSCVGHFEAALDATSAAV